MKNIHEIHLVQEQELTFELAQEEKERIQELSEKIDLCHEELLKTNEEIVKILEKILSLNISSEQREQVEQALKDFKINKQTINILIYKSKNEYIRNESKRKLQTLIKIIKNTTKAYKKEIRNYKKTLKEYEQEMKKLQRRKKQ